MSKTIEAIVAAARTQITEVSVAEARALAAEGATLIDVREPPEWAAGTIEGALTIPRGVLEWKAPAAAALARRDAPVVVYCQSGGRSALAAVALGELGYTNVSSLAGGYNAWSAED